MNSGINSIAIFAERRKGKTEFLIEDLAPYAQSQGFKTVYINFWEQRSDPIYCIAKGVKRALQSDGSTLLKHWKKEVNITLPGFEVKAQDNNNNTQALAYESLEQLLKNKGNVLLMFDEIQHLATDAKFEELIATLRTFLDSNKKSVKAVFTGSSQHRLNKIFRHQKAAFYRGASLVDFPNMGEGFVHHLVSVFHSITSNQLDEEKGNAIFEQYHYSPFLLVDLMQTMMREGIDDFDHGLEYYQRTNNPNQQWADLWHSLKLIDQLILTQVIITNQALYHSDTYALLGDRLGIDDVKRGMVQSAVNRLRDSGILVSASRGLWEFESAEFRDYLQDEV
ncbi:MAG: hypothetical protein ACI8WB_005784 [Phenylobacterium sp.]